MIKPQLSDIIHNGKILNPDKDFREDIGVRLIPIDGDSISNLVQLRENDLRLHSYPHSYNRQCLLQMSVTHHQRLFIIDTHVVDFTEVDGVLVITFEGTQELTELLVNVLYSVILLDPHMQLALHLLRICIPSLVYLLVFRLLAVVNHHPSSLLHSQLILQVVIHVLVHYVDLTHTVVPHLHLQLSLAPGCVVLLD